MSLTLTVNMDTLTPAQAKLAAGFILSYVKGVFDEPEPETKEHLTIREVDPAQLFGPASIEGEVSQAGPHLIVPAPPATEQPAAPADSGVILDLAGLPWDGRIHASSKATNKDGTWREKRGVDKAVVTAITAELKRAMAAPGPQLVPSPVAPPPPPPAAGNTPPADESAARQKYIALVGRASQAVGAGKLTQDQIKKCLTSLDVENLPALGHRLDLVDVACALIDGLIAGQSV